MHTQDSDVLSSPRLKRFVIPVHVEIVRSGCRFVWNSLPRPSVAATVTMNRRPQERRFGVGGSTRAHPESHRRLRRLARRGRDRLGSLVFVQWSTDDLPTRDLFLVTGHHADLDGKTLAHLAGISEAQVSRVLSHFAIHGWRGLVERGAAGRAPALGPVGKAKARALREQGVTLADIAEQLGVGIRSVRTATAGVVVRPGPTPIALPSAPPAADRVVVAAEDDHRRSRPWSRPSARSRQPPTTRWLRRRRPGKDPLGPAAPLAADGAVASRAGTRAPR